MSVQLHGSSRRGEDIILPIFARWNWGKVLGAHVLSICDPTIYQDEALTVGWYLGTRDESAIPGIVAIARRCADLLGIPDDHIVFSGSSGGGFAALQAAAAAKNGRAIAINAQTNLSKFNMNEVGSYIDKVSGCTSLSEAELVFAQRWNAIRSLHEAVAKGNTPKVVFVQNRNDWHYQAHFTPFAEAFALSLLDDQSNSGNFMSILYDGANAHEPEPSEVVKRVNSDGLPFLLNRAVSITDQPKFRTQIRRDAGQILAEIKSVPEEVDDSYQFACYLYKDGTLVEKQFYTENRKFVFNLCGAGKYMCRGYVRDHTGLITPDSSEVLEVRE